MGYNKNLITFIRVMFYAILLAISFLITIAINVVFFSSAPEVSAPPPDIPIRSPASDNLDDFYVHDKSMPDLEFDSTEAVEDTFTFLDMIEVQATQSSSTIIPNLTLDAAVKKDQVPVFFATNRQKDGLLSRTEGAKYSNNRGYKNSYGKIIVNIPSVHTSGEIERPRWWFMPENKEKHFMFLNQDDYANAVDFFSQLQREGTKKTLIFIHGYNVPFEDSIFRTAQLSHDIQFSGTALAFTWPSKGRLQSYVADEADAEWSIPYFAEFLQGVLKHQKDNDIYIIAHSMGSRVVSQALRTVNPADSARIRELILAAPDIDADVFNEQILPAFKKHALMTTLYASTTDNALRASQFLHGNRRLGSTIGSLASIELIDATYGKVDLLGHSNFAQHETLLHDMYKIIECNVRASRRNLEEKMTTTIKYWSMPKERKKVPYSCEEIVHSPS